MWDDPIVAETRILRAEIASKYDFDVEALGAYLSQMSVADAQKLIQEAVHSVANRQGGPSVMTEKLPSVLA